MKVIKSPHIPAILSVIKFRIGFGTVTYTPLGVEVTVDGTITREGGSEAMSIKYAIIKPGQYRYMIAAGGAMAQLFVIIYSW